MGVCSACRAAKSPEAKNPPLIIAGLTLASWVAHHSARFIWAPRNVDGKQKRLVRIFQPEYDVNYAMYYAPTGEADGGGR